eukprot:CAMPEP_0182453492 /NCGR_PEP_ID=MMETSP1319-20130603/531_1 /TAXON_ID=172717 /ORGANISM="Bolidomonas pacifica, Strain RCC208" /LENGTH=48 /DNA_ID= /DNA_START= /DNA_END= /DNA_ORIENTATION=
MIFVGIEPFTSMLNGLLFLEALVLMFPAGEMQFPMFSVLVNFCLMVKW